MMPARDANIAELSKPQATQRDTTTQSWEQWISGQFDSLHRALGVLLAEERRRSSRNHGLGT
jgi:hypothetical protein